MASPFQPLLQLVLIAVSPWGLPRVVDARLGGGSSSSSSASPLTASAATAPTSVARDRHSSEPVTLAVEDAGGDTPPWDPVDRYQVLARDQQGTLWVTQNGVSSTLPPPPGLASGPVGCDCPNFDGQRGSRYGSMQKSNLRFWMADHYDETRPYAPYIPDLFCSMGPCFARTPRASLAQWDPAWAVPHADGVQLVAEKKAEFLAWSRTDDAARKALRLEARPAVPAPLTARDVEELHNRLGHWVAHRMETRGRILARLMRNDYWRIFREKFNSLWDDMRAAGYFAHVPVGTWVLDTTAQVSKIRELQHAGVPVYYRWRTEFNDEQQFPHLAVLRPPRGLDDAPRQRVTPPEPPSTPSKAAREFTLPAKSVLWSPARRSAPAPDNTYTVHVAPSSLAHQPTPSESRADPKRVKIDDRASLTTALEAFNDEAFWDRANDFLNAQEGSSAAVPKLLARITDPGTSSAGEHGESLRPGDPSSSAAEPRAPRDERRYVLLKPPLVVRVENDKPYRSALRDRVADDMRVDAPRSVNRSAGANAFKVVGGAKPPRTFEERITVDPRRVELRLYIQDTDVAEKFVDEFLDQHPEASEADIVRFLLDRQMPFNWAFPLRGIDTRGRSFPKQPYERYCISPDLSLHDSYSRWFEGGRAVLSIERVQRAVAARGGVLVRIAKLMGLGTVFRKFPCAFVCTDGGPNLVNVDEESNMFYYDDWLEQEEIDILLGSAVKDGVARSIMPALEAFDTFYAGAWGVVYENWFKDRLQELDASLKKNETKGFFIAKNAWNKKLKKYSFA